ncbi:MAG: 3-phosphoshikimate 1-carboxyvinyltransferase [Omnitrophica WOR_2 bacterium SM23_29]|nr:MAG: 3-phosphoshikimate 1-carboxyvinyltransferase [Omnitrophica WOR_2 bacterium SM23_29]
MEFKVTPAKRLFGSIILPGDKSISHRAIMLSSIANGTSRIRNFLYSADTGITISAFRALGINIQESRGEIIVNGKGRLGLSKPPTHLYMGNSGTTMRILMGILAGQPFQVILTADDSLSKRPMGRVTEPLRTMGAEIVGKDEANYAPITIHGRKLKAIDCISKIASAQVKSAIILAGLYADGITSVIEPSKSRDHTERMLRAYGAQVSIEGLKVSIKGGVELKSQDVEIPGDISGAAFFIVGAAIAKGSSIVLRSGINPTRSGVIDILKMMGAKINIKNIKETVSEPIGDICVESSDLHGISMEGDLIPRAIDELPVVMVAAAYAEGMTVIRGAHELRYKETDRINSMAINLKAMGAGFSVKGDEITIVGSKNLKGIRARSFGDHRTAMSMVIAGLAAQGETTIDDVDCVIKSYPDFVKHLQTLLV